MLTITGKSRTTASTKIGHDVNGGTFSQDDTYLVLYGMPFKENTQYPQANYLTVYKLGGQQKAVMKQAYGAGIYSADFSADGRFVAFTTRLAVNILNEEKRSIESHDPIFTSEFSLQSCKKN